MRTTDIYKTLVGAGVVYVAVAACSGAEHAGAGGACGHGSGGNDSGIIDPVPKACADPVSGSRLKAKYRVAEDGSKEHLPDTWYDSMRGEDCVFLHASDGKERCLPVFRGKVSYYTDPGCSVPVAEQDKNPPCSPPKYVGIESPGCVWSSWGVATVGAQVTPGALYTMSPQGCMGIGAPNINRIYYQVGAEIPLSSFVAATQQHD